MNGPWFQEVHDFSEAFIADVLERHRKLVEERLISIREATEAEEHRNEQMRARFGKPASWISAADGRTGRNLSEEYVVWYDPEEFRYVIEVYGPTHRLLASRSLECSYEPRFGMDAFDHARIFGEQGELSRLIDSVEDE